MQHKSTSWAHLLVHPLPLASVGLLAVNDHLLKGSGLLPSAITGKLSDIAGLFFFPALLFCAVRGIEQLARRPAFFASDRLAFACAFVTGTGFSAVKLFPPFNALISRVWGRMWMDTSDLWTLAVLPFSLVFMLHRSREYLSEPSSARLRKRTPMRAALDFAAVFIAGLASAATSQQPPPVPPPPPPPPPPIVAEPAQVAADPGVCASLTISTCERSASTSFVVIDIAGQGSGSCAVRISQAMEIGFAGSLTEADRLPSTITVKEGERATFSLSFFRRIADEEMAGTTRVRLATRRAHDLLTAPEEELELSAPCKSR